MENCDVLFTIPEMLETFYFKMSSFCNQLMGVVVDEFTELLTGMFFLLIFTVISYMKYHCNKQVVVVHCRSVDSVNSDTSNERRDGTPASFKRILTRILQRFLFSLHLLRAWTNLCYHGSQIQNH